MSDFERQIQKGIVQASTALQDAEALAPSELYSKQFREARKVLSASMAGVSDLRVKLQASERDAKRMTEALDKYGRHLANCASSFGFSKGYSRPCDCGFGDFFGDTDDN